MKKLIPALLLSLLLIQPPAAEASSLFRKCWTLVAYLCAGTVAGPVLGTAVWAVTELQDDNPKKESKPEETK